MERSRDEAGGGKTRRAIVQLLKTEGPMDSARLGERLSLTAMAVRQHLYALQREKLVTADERPVPVGRPVKQWRLTREADRLFPDSYAELNVALLDAVGDSFGKEGIERVLAARCARQQAEYARRIARRAPLEEKLEQLARVRTEEGYMAEVRPDGDTGYLLIENHCPICAAAAACQGFCAMELQLFQAVLGPGVAIERVEHILASDRRCAYRIKPSSAGPPDGDRDRVPAAPRTRSRRNRR
jgi:predicted ArsR family transcriptional regulator